MGLRGHEWFLGCCLEEERARTPESYLASRVLDLGLLRTEKTRGHVWQACGALQKFFDARPAVPASIRTASPFDPYAMDAHERAQWSAWFATKSGSFGHPRFSYNYDTLRGYLTPLYGGTRHGGGGGNNEFELAARLLAKFV